MADAAAAGGEAATASSAPPPAAAADAAAAPAAGAGEAGIGSAGVFVPPPPGAPGAAAPASVVGPEAPALAASTAALSEAILASGLASADLGVHGSDIEEELRRQIEGALADGIDPKAIAAVFAASGTAQPPPAIIPGSPEALALGGARKPEYPEERCVFVGGLEGGDGEIWPEDLAEHFKACGDIRRVTIKIDKVTGDRLGFAYVDFNDDAGAATALSLDGAPFGPESRALRVKQKRPTTDSKGKGKGKKGCGWGGGKGKDWGGGWGGGGGYWGVTNRNWGKGGGGGGGWGPY